MRRRGLANALQLALGAVGGAAGGYVQDQERKRKQLLEDEERQRRKALEEAGIRAEQRDILRSGGTQIAGMGEQVAGPVPSAIPLSGVGNAFAAAEQAGGPATSRGAMRQTVGGQTFMLPGAAETRAQALANALELARAERGVTREFAAEDEQKAETKAFNALKRLGKVKGEFDPEYGQYAADLADERAIRRSRATQAGGPSDTSENKLRETFLTKYFSEYGEMPQRTQVDEFVRLARGGRTIDDLFPADGTPAPRQAAAKAMPSMATPTGGMFARDMFTSPVGAAQSGSIEERALASRLAVEEIRALAARLAELKRGGRGTIAAREQYERNAPERARIQAALDEAQRRYRAGR